MQQANPITCGNCGTENPPDEEFCQQCGQPLTRSAQEGMIGQEEAQVEGGVFDVGEVDDQVGAPGLDEGPPSPRNPHRGT